MASSCTHCAAGFATVHNHVIITLNLQTEYFLIIVQNRLPSNAGQLKDGEYGKSY